MENEAKTENPFADIMGFYIKQAELLAPVIKQGMEDWFAVYTKLMTESMRLQAEWMKQGFGTK